MTASTIDKIVDIAESQVRSGGYNSFSFREISKKIGIKSASIHYHFPSKVDLGVVVARRYTDRFVQSIEEISSVYPVQKKRLERYIALFRHSLKVDKKMCLCGVLASEIDVLPDPVRLETNRFFKVNLEWLTSVLFAECSNAATNAALLLGSLEGALLMGKVMDSEEQFNQIAEYLLNQTWE